ncbi:MAG: hypothetical protein RUMPE_00166 [Eubacteriales bacterium SKADARSKE-1]|nr:hypothetical protein [Eubacteriales bacterium SKADARSKE-1]
MKILVVSDTHGDSKNLYKVVMGHPEAKIIIHLGDGERDIDKIRDILKDKTILQVCGNCDICSSLPKILEETIAGKKIFATHGNLFKVKSDLDRLIQEAIKSGANVALFGHTHRALNVDQENLYIMNPGNLYGINGTYGIIDIDSGNIKGSIGKVCDLEEQSDYL